MAEELLLGHLADARAFVHADEASRVFAQVDHVDSAAGD